MSRVTGIESGAVVLGSGTLNWRRFERRPEETLVFAELLDRKVKVLESGARSPSSTSRWSSPVRATGC